MYRQGLPFRIEAGERIALEVVRHHRLIELYLVEALGYGWDEVHDEAERLEHHISEKLEARIAARLGQPTFDPHGDPIPSLEGTLPADADAHLADLQVGDRACITRVRDQQPELQERRPRILERGHALTGRELALRVLLGDAVRTAAQAELLFERAASFAQFTGPRCGGDGRAGRRGTRCAHASCDCRVANQSLM